jgi:general secretion pathway protein G
MVMRRQPALRSVVRGRGFTLLELIIVVAIIGILAAIAMPALKDVPKRAAEAVLRSNLTTLRDVIDQHYADKGNYPPSLEALVEAGYLRTIPRDPITRSSDTWVVEYQEIGFDEEPAETDLPEGGAPGVIDVHSGSGGLSLDGEAYSEW